MAGHLAGHLAGLSKGLEVGVGVILARKGIMVGNQKGVNPFNWEHRGRRKSPSREKKEEKYKIEPEWAPEIKPKHRNSLPNRRQQNPRGRRRRRRLVVFDLVRYFICFGIISGAHSGSILAKLFGYSTCLIPHCSQFKAQGYRLRGGPGGAKPSPEAHEIW